MNIDEGRLTISGGGDEEGEEGGGMEDVLVWEG